LDLKLPVVAEESNNSCSVPETSSIYTQMQQGNNSELERDNTINGLLQTIHTFRQEAVDMASEAGTNSIPEEPKAKQTMTKPVKTPRRGFPSGGPIPSGAGDGGGVGVGDEQEAAEVSYGVGADIAHMIRQAENAGLIPPEARFSPTLKIRPGATGTRGKPDPAARKFFPLRGFHEGESSSNATSSANAFEKIKALARPQTTRTRSPKKPAEQQSTARLSEGLSGLKLTSEGLVPTTGSPTSISNRLSAEGPQATNTKPTRPLTSVGGTRKSAGATPSPKLTGTPIPKKDQSNINFKSIIC